MDKKSIPVIVGVAVVGLILSIVGNYLFLNATIPPVPADTLEVEGAEPEEFDELDLTWDITGESGVRPSRKIDDKKQRREEILAITDSIVTGESEPIREELEDTKQELEETKESIGDLEDLLAQLTSAQDSVDADRAKRLSKILETMKPSNAATILSRLNPRANAELLLKMRQKQAAKILAALPRERAAEVARYLSQAYAGSSI